MFGRTRWWLDVWRCNKHALIQWSAVNWSWSMVALVVGDSSLLCWRAELQLGCGPAPNLLPHSSLSLSLSLSSTRLIISLRLSLLIDLRRWSEFVDIFSRLCMLASRWRPKPCEAQTSLACWPLAPSSSRRLRIGPPLFVNKQSGWSSAVTLRALGEILITQRPLCQTSVSTLTAAQLGTHVDRNTNTEQPFSAPTHPPPFTAATQSGARADLAVTRIFGSSGRSENQHRNLRFCGLICWLKDQDLEEPECSRVRYGV